MSQTRNTSEEIDFGMKEKMFVLFAAFVAIIIVFSAKVHQWYAKLWQRLEEFDYKITVLLSNYNIFSDIICFSRQKIWFLGIWMVFSWDFIDVSARVSRYDCDKLKWSIHQVCFIVETTFFQRYDLIFVIQTCDFTAF